MVKGKLMSRNLLDTVVAITSTVSIHTAISRNRQLRDSPTKILLEASYLLDAVRLSVKNIVVEFFRYCTDIYDPL